MSNCVYIDLGDGDFIKPNFSKKPTPKMIEEMRQWGLAHKAKRKEMEAKGICFICEGKKFRGSLDPPYGKIPCDACKGTGTVQKTGKGQNEAD